jgi:hypothetical protein
MIWPPKGAKSTKLNLTTNLLDGIIRITSVIRIARFTFTGQIFHE